VKITALKPQQRNRKRVSVFLDDRFAFGLDQELVIKLGLHAGLEIDAARLARIAQEAERKKALDASFNLLAWRARSRKEIETRLKRKDISETAIRETSQRLAELGLLDDVKFAEAFARDRLEFARKGKRVIYAELRRKGVPKPVVEQVLARSGAETEAATAVLDKTARRYTALEPRERYRKLHDLLLRRGFSFETIEHVLREHERQAEAADDKE
jgi:regulatory protein